MNQDKVDVPITEQSNPLTQNIDQQNSLGIVRQLFSSDCQIFDGTPPFPGFNDPSFIANMRRVSAELGKLRSMVDSDVKVIMSGCGTSGRIAFIMCRLLNALLRSEDTGSSSTQSQMYTYLIAGGDKALFTSQEAPEDDPRLGATDLIQAAEGCSKVIYMGITCGLSAPYVAGQLNHCLRNLDIFTPILIGFNPSHLARKSEIKGWDKTFYDVAMEMENCSEAIILNPVVGPESITGSSRMKGGTATKIILDIVYLLHKNSDSTYKEHYRESLSLYQDACRHLYGEHSSDLSALIDIAAQSLLLGGRVVYCGRDTDGIIAMVDASECVPTYGSDRNDIRGYMPGGYINLGNMEGDISHLGPEFLIDWEDYVRDNGHQLDEKDVILSFDAAALGIPSLSQCKARKVFISVDNNHDAASWSDELLVETFSISSLPNQTDTDSATLYKQLLRCMYVKWVCNAISTGAHILKGKVYHNIMIDVRVSNRKLYQRAIGIIMNLTQCTTEMAEFKLQSVVFEENVEKLRSLDVVIEKASSMNLVLPTSLLMILNNCSHSEAHLLLKQEPIVRKAIGKYCKSV